MSDIEIEIDGRKLSAAPTQTVMEVADAAGIYIPRFCYHKHLSIAANCRMCLVEVEKSPKTLPACATPVMAGMKVFTKSAKTVEAQRAVMEFLLINHPLDCPVCDQGGECELQDISMGYGSGLSHYDECKRAVPNDDLGSLIATEMTRCIQCTRCVRFGEEIAGMRELGVTYRGEHEAISTYVAQSMKSEVSGNIIDLCPVGALTSKPYRFTARAWELSQAPTISPHDCVGSHLNVHTRTGTVMRVVAKENAATNETWLSDRDRFSYTGLYEDRLTDPMIKENGAWQTVSWERALEFAAKRMQEVIRTHGPEEWASLASPSATLEEYYLLQQLTRGVGSSNIDHRLRQQDTRDQSAMPAFVGATIGLTELEQCDAILLVGSNLQKEQPLAALRLRKAQKAGAVILAINPVDYQFNFHLDAKRIVAPHRLIATLEALSTAVSDPGSTDALAKQLRGKKNIAIIVGALAEQHTEAALIRSLTQQLATQLQAQRLIMTSGANSAGAWLAGAVPHRLPGGKAVAKAGDSAYELLKQPRRGYLLLNVEPALDCANAQEAVAAMTQADCVISLSMYRDALLEAHADVLLPITPFTETSGTFVTMSGQWQTFRGVSKPYEQSRPAWKVLQALAQFMSLAGFGYASSEEVRKAVEDYCGPSASSLPLRYTEQAMLTRTVQQANTLTRIGEIPIYAIDSLVRRAMPLQQAQTVMEGEVSAVRLHPDTLTLLGLKTGERAIVQQGKARVSLAVLADERIPHDAAWVAAGVSATTVLGDLFGEIVISPEGKAHV